MDQIDESPSNARRIYRPERIKEMAASLAANGQETPGFATMRNGRYLLGAGGYRIRGLKVINAKTMELLVWDNLTDRELYELSYRENKEREGHSALDDALSWREHIERGTFAGEADIVAATGLSESNVNKTMAILKLSSTVLNIVTENPEAFKLSVLYELYLYEKVAGDQKAAVFARQILEGKCSRQQIIDARELASTPKHRKQKEQSRQYKIDGAGLERGVLKEWDSGKIALELDVKDPLKRTQLVEALRQLLDKPEQSGASEPGAPGSVG
jgi:ParB family transcriptional regulator, chromosome partitioning protein